MTSEADGNANNIESFDVIVIGSGPGGQSAATEAARAGRSALIIERETKTGGCCVRTGTIPSKSLRETAIHLSSLRDRTQGVCDIRLPADARLKSLMARLGAVVEAQQAGIGRRLASDGVRVWGGKARFEDQHTIAVQDVRGAVQRARGRVIVIATGSVPRTPTDLDVDHEHILDSDSILSLHYLPRSLLILGGGVIACEYASIFAALDVKVTIVDRGPRPMPFLDPQLSEAFVRRFTEKSGGRYLPDAAYESVAFDGFAAVRTVLKNGTELEAEKVLFTLGRVARIDGLDLDNAGIQPTERGLLAINEHQQTSVPHIYAVGDVIGAPALASAANDQGRRAMRHALGLPVGPGPEVLPVGIFTIPEMSSVGLTESEAVERHGSCRVGQARFAEVARGHIAAATDGFLKLVANADGTRLLGAQMFGDGSTELIHLAQLAMLAEATLEDVFVRSVFNFPTMAEAYRVATMRILDPRTDRSETSNEPSACSTP